MRSSLVRRMFSKAERLGLPELQIMEIGMRLRLTVHMFDRDLKEVIRADNRDLIAQALERAAAEEEEKKPKTVTLSELDSLNIKNR